MTVPALESRALLLKDALAAFARRDVDALYRTTVPDFIWCLPVGPEAPVARQLRSKAEVAAYFEERNQRYLYLRFDNDPLQHGPLETTMTFRVSGRLRDAGEEFVVWGMERYTFRDGLIAMKDAYWKRIAAE